MLVSIEEARNGAPNGLSGAMTDSVFSSSGLVDSATSTPPSMQRPTEAVAQAVALFDFEAESPFEMSFRKVLLHERRTNNELHSTEVYEYK